MNRVSLGLALCVLLGPLALTACGVGELYAGMPDHVKKRHLALEGAPNFRDLGGYATSGRPHREVGTASTLGRPRTT